MSRVQIPGAGTSGRPQEDTPNRIAIRWGNTDSRTSCHHVDRVGAEGTGDTSNHHVKTGINMNKLIKGAVAGAAGVALLLGGAGTFALWNSTETVAAGSVASGTLTLAKTGTAAWKNISTDAPAGGTVIPSISSYKIVPGDKLELTQSVTINATGNNLAATLSYDDSTIAAVGTANAALKSALVFVADASGGANVTRIGTTNTFAVAPAATTSTVVLKITIELPASTSGVVAQGGNIDLSALAFKLQQNARA